METTLWIAQILAAAVFGLAGLLTALVPKEKLRPKLPWVEDFAAPVVRLIGLAELAGAAGLLIPFLTPFAALGLAVMMVLAAVVHLRRGEGSAIAVNAVLFALTAFIAAARLLGWPS